MTPHEPLPFITKLRKEADSFADAITLCALACAAYVAGKTVGHWFGWWGAVTPATAHMVSLYMWFWLACKAVWATVDYAIYAVTHAATEYLDTFLKGCTESVTHAADAERAPVPTQRETAVAYLHDFLKRPRQAFADGAAPADPSSPSAA